MGLLANLPISQLSKLALRLFDKLKAKKLFYHNYLTDNWINWLAEIIQMTLLTNRTGNNFFLSELPGKLFI